MILLLPALATAEHKTGNDLQRDCSVALKVFNNQVVTNQEDVVKMANCIGFVSGVMQASALRDTNPGNRQGQGKDAAKQFCATPDVTVEKVVRMALRRLESNPEDLNLDASVIVVRAMKEGFPTSACLGGPTGQDGGLLWPAFPKKERIRLRLVAVALAEPRSSFFSSHEVLVAEKEIAEEEFSLIKLVFTYLPYQPRLSESGFDYSVVHEVSAWRDPDCDETVDQLTARTMPDRHEPLIYSSNVPREDLDRRRIPLPCYQTKADDYIKATSEPIPQPEKQPYRPVLSAHPDASAAQPAPAVKAPAEPTPAPDGRPVLKVRPTPTPED